MLIRLASILAVLSPMIEGVIIAAAIYALVRTEAWFKTLTVIFLCWSVAYAAFLTIGQYLVWSMDPFLHALVFVPVAPQGVVPSALVPLLSLFHFPHGYFIFYALDHFWMPLIVALVLAGLFYGVLRALRRWRRDIFSVQEMEIGFLCALLSGWPGIVILIPLALLSALLFSIVRLVWMHEERSSLAAPFIAATAFLFAWKVASASYPIIPDPISFMHLSALRSF